MDKTMILTVTKKDMTQLIESITFENLEEVKQHLEKYFAFLETLTTLPDLPELNNHQPESAIEIELENEMRELETGIQEDSLPHVQVVEADLSEEEAFPDLQQESSTQQAYRFERKLRGGFLPEIEAFIPEGIIRKLGLEHGDLVRATKLENELHKYIYELFEKGDGKEPEGRIQLDYCIVEKEAGSLVVKKYGGEQVIRLDEVPYTMILPEKDIREFSINEGDLIDLAFFRTNPHLCKILWKHSLDQEISSSPLHSGYYKNKYKEDKQEDKPAAILPEENLSGKKVLVIGCEPKKAIFKQNIEERGGEFLWADGNEGKERLTAFIRKADVVVLLIRFMRHQGSKDAVEICKSLDVPFCIVENLGIKSLITEALQSLSA